MTVKCKKSAPISCMNASANLEDKTTEEAVALQFVGLATGATHYMRVFPWFVTRR